MSAVANAAIILDAPRWLILCFSLPLFPACPIKHDSAAAGGNPQGCAPITHLRSAVQGPLVSYGKPSEEALSGALITH